MKQTLFCIIAFAMFSISLLQASEMTKEIVLYDATVPFPEKHISSLSNGRILQRENVMDVTSFITPRYSGVKLTGNWNLSGYNKLQVTITNYNTKEYLPLTIHLEGPNASLSAQKSIFLERIYVPAGETKTFEIDLPVALPLPQVKSLCRGMRRDPFFQWGSISSLDLDTETVVAIAVYVHRPREVWNWGLKRINVYKGKESVAYPWYHMTAEEFFPFIDQYGQFRHRDWEGKTHSDTDLKDCHTQELADLQAHPGPKDRSKYGGWLSGPKLEARGHFRVEKLKGKWWLVDPDGYLFWSHGVVRITPSSGITPLDNRELYFADLPDENGSYGEFYQTRDTLLHPYYEARNIKKTYDFSAANIKRKYGDSWRKEYAWMAQKRIKSWGLNTIANSSDKSICLMRQTPYVDRIELKSPELESSKGVWWKFRDPFHPEFKRNFRKQLLERKIELDDPWCIGFFVDNEIDWGEEHTLGEWTLQCPSNQPAKIEMLKVLQKKYKQIEHLNKVWGTEYTSWQELLRKKEKPGKGSEEDCVLFSNILTEAYFRNVKDEFKKLAPDKLYMGCRFARSNENVLRIGAKYCDIISYNIYKINLNGFALPEGIDKPVMIGEFHFGALDRGLFHPGLVKTANQQERADRYVEYVESSLRHPNIIGTHWHQFSDQATSGRFDGENFQVGFVDICDRPYPETIAGIRKVGYQLYKLRYGQQ